MKHLRLLVCALLALLAFLVYVIVKTVSLDGIQGLMLDQPLLGPLALIFIMATAVVIVPVPNLPWDFLAGATYGPFIGTLLVLLGGTLGAGIAFTIAKHV